MFEIKNSDILYVDSVFKYEIYKDLEPSYGSSILSYSILTFQSKNDSFLVLLRTKNQQIIVEYSPNATSIRTLCYFPRYLIVISASLSANRDKLLVVFFSSSNTFTECSHYIVKCILVSEKPQITYPICNILSKEPTIQWLTHPNRFVLFTNNGRYEIWELICSKTEFNLHKISKSENGIIWINISSFSGLIEYIKPKGDQNWLCTVKEDNTISKINIPTDAQIIKQLPPSEDNQQRSLSFYNHIRTQIGQDILLIYGNEVLSIVLLKSGVQLNVSYVHKGSYDFFNIATVRNDLVLINLQEYCFLFILIDAVSQPRAIFTIKQKINPSFIFTSCNDYKAIDSKNGNYMNLIFNYEEIIKARPHLFLPLLHDSAMEDCFDKKLFSLLTNDILAIFWNGVIFDEFLLCWVRSLIQKALNPQQLKFFTEELTTFCPVTQYQQYLALFTPFQSRFVDSIKFSPPIPNWGRLINKYPTLIDDSLSEQLISILISISRELYPEESIKIIMIQMLALLFRISNEIPNEKGFYDSFLSNIFCTFPQIIKEAWIMREIIPYEELYKFYDSKKSIDLKTDSNEEIIYINDSDFNWWKSRKMILGEVVFSEENTFDETIKMLENTPNYSNFIKI